MSVTHSYHSAAFELRRLSWTQLAGYAYLGFFILLLVRLAAPEAIGPALRTLAFALPLVLLAAKDLAHLPDALQRLRGANGWRGRILELLPPELIGMARLDRLMWIGFLQWLRRRKPLARPEGTALTTARRVAREHVPEPFEQVRDAEHRLEIEKKDLGRAIREAKRPPCTKKYSGGTSLNVFALIPLAIDTITDTGCKW